MIAESDSTPEDCQRPSAVGGDWLFQGNQIVNFHKTSIGAAHDRRFYCLRNTAYGLPIRAFATPFGNVRIEFCTPQFLSFTRGAFDETQN
jgi:hypothetical protein